MEYKARRGKNYCAYYRENTINSHIYAHRCTKSASWPTHRYKRAQSPLEICTMFSAVKSVGDIIENISLPFSHARTFSRTLLPPPPPPPCVRVCAGEFSKNAIPTRCARVNSLVHHSLSYEYFSTSVLYFLFFFSFNF